MLYGAYRDNLSYCEPYIDKETFDKMQTIGRRNIKENTSERRAYLFSGLLICPDCGCKLAGTYATTLKPDGSRYQYKKYRCAGFRLNRNCSFPKAVSENVIERMLLKNIEQYLEDAKVRILQIEDSGEDKIPQYDVEEVHAEIDRLNYAWQKGRIRKVEQYEEQYEALMKKLEKSFLIFIK
jgi:hypothetical protein